MRYFALTALAVIFWTSGTIATHAQTTTSEFNKDVVKRECSAEWGSDFAMVKYCMDQRGEGFVQFHLYRVQVPPGMLPSLDLCVQKWGEQWEMTAYCAEEEINGVMQFGRIVESLPKDADPSIAEHCVQKWINQWSMAAFCLQENVDAWRALNQ